MREGSRSHRATDRDLTAIAGTGGRDPGAPRGAGRNRGGRLGAERHDRRELEKVVGLSAANSNSFKFATATCPAGKRAIGSGGQVGGQSGTFPNEMADVAITFLEPSDEDTVPGSVTAFAYEVNPTSANWSVEASALCANVS
jgi:hypothetical protein